jgi:hypothetical protein
MAAFFNSAFYTYSCILSPSKSSDISQNLLLPRRKFLTKPTTAPPTNSLVNLQQTTAMLTPYF